MSEDRRENHRIDIDDGLSGSITVVEPMRVAQISPTGAQIDTTAALKVGTLHDIRLSLDVRPVVVKARVVHSSVRHLHRELVFYRTGVEFIDLTPRAANTIAQFVEHLVAHRNGAPATAAPAGDDE